MDLGGDYEGTLVRLGDASKENFGDQFILDGF
jgi:hypothetical protein